MTIFLMNSFERLNVVQLTLMTLSDTLFKREDMAKATVKAYSVENDNILYVAKITTKNDKRKIFKYKILIHMNV